MFQSTLPARGATSRSVRRPQSTAVSIHAPRAGSDSRGSASSSRPWGFNPRSPRGERPEGLRGLAWPIEFQSTLPARGATYQHKHGYIKLHVSIHAPRAGSDGARRTFRNRNKVFQSTLPARGATGRLGASRATTRRFNPRSPRGERPAHADGDSTGGNVSIHAPRAGSDAILGS